MKPYTRQKYTKTKTEQKLQLEAPKLAWYM